jgi:hypothetical protein
VAAPKRSTTLVVAGPLAIPDIALLCDRARIQLSGGDARILICDVGEAGPPDAVTVEALARLQMTARSLGCHVELRDASGELRELIGLMGLAEVLPCCEELPLEPRRQAEQREPPCGVEEERDPADPVT